jgi:hypothetical protein
MIEFHDDDAGYLDWIARHLNGFVLNVRETPDPEYVVLHRARCPSISTSREPGAYTERSYRKYCSESVEDLRHAARQEGRRDGSFSRRCGMCGP